MSDGPFVKIPLVWTDARAGYQCPYCSLYVCIPRTTWATCPRCPGAPIDEVAALALTGAGFDEDEADNAIKVLQPLLDALIEAGRP